MVVDLILRLKAVLSELEAEGNVELATRVQQAIRDLERGQQVPRPGILPRGRTSERHIF